MSGTAGTVASQRIADVLAERILTGRLTPGARIIQDELAEEFQASRIPVREALRILETRGLVTLRANAGAWVSAMTLRDLGLSYEIRERIEPLLLADSLGRLTDQDVRTLAELQEEIERNEDVETFLRLDREFHWLTYARHEAPQLASMIERLWDTTQHYRRAYVQLAQSQSSWTVNVEHRLLIESVRAGDVRTASAVLEMHIRRTRIALEAHPELFPDSS